MKIKKFEKLLKKENNSIEVKHFDKVFQTSLQEKTFAKQSTQTPMKSESATSAQQRKKLIPRWRFAFLAFCSMAMIVVMLVLFLPLGPNAVSASELTSYIFEINPSFCVTSNSENKVISICALNQDADEIVSNEIFDELGDMDLSFCFEKIISLSFEHGFFSDYPDDHNIKIFAINNKPDFAEQKANFAKEMIEKDLQVFGLNINIEQGPMTLKDFRGRMEFENDFSDLDKFLGELENRRYFDPNFTPPKSQNICENLF